MTTVQDAVAAGGGAVQRYASLADELLAMISAGQLRPGDRLPSVRSLARHRGISPTTAVAALRMLERRGAAEARPQSGYYVRRRAPLAPAPRAARPSEVARPVEVDALVGMLGAANARRDVVHFSSALPDPSWFPARALQRHAAGAARRDPRLLDRYGEPAGLPALRRRIALRHAEFGCALDEDELLVTNGCMEALNLAVRAVARPGEAIAVESPAYFGALQVLEGRGLRAVEIPSDPRDGLSVEALEAVLQSRSGPPLRACLLSGNVTNPLGATMPEARKRALLEVCRRHDLAVIEDDIYGELAFGRRPPPIKAFDRDGRVILCSSFSKTLAPGARIGWIAAGRWAGAVTRHKYVTSVATPLLLQRALADFLAASSYERHLRRLRLRCEAQVDRFSEAVHRAFPRGTRISQPTGGFVLWVELPRGNDALELHGRAVAAGIGFLPGPVFSAGGRFRSCLRLSCGRPWDADVQRALRRLGALAGGA